MSNYIARLYKTYPEVIKYTKLDALDNEDKRELEDRSQNEANNFWEWFEEKYPDRKEKIFKKFLDPDINKYCFENAIYEFEFRKYFWNYSKYPLKKIRIDDKTNW
ncbi:hypothetical protein ACFLY2_02805 [Patescibacteria group bacterium]